MTSYFMSSPHLKVEPWRGDEQGEVKEEALFAARPISEGSLVAFYTGLLAPCNLEFEALFDTAARGLRGISDARTSYLISLAKHKASQATMN